MNYIVIFFIFFLAVFLYSSVITVPFVLAILLLLYIFYREDWVFFLAFLVGICIDFLTLQSIGGSSFFLLVYLFLIFLYQRKFEISSYYFVFFALFMGTMFYSLTFSLAYGFFLALGLAVSTTICFWILQKVTRYQKNPRTFL